MAQNRKGAGKQLKHFRPSDHRPATPQAQTPHGHSGDNRRQAGAGQRGAQHGGFVDRAPKGPRKGQ